MKVICTIIEFVTLITVTVTLFVLAGCKRTNKPDNIGLKDTISVNDSAQSDSVKQRDVIVAEKEGADLEKESIKPDTIRQRHIIVEKESTNFWGHGTRTLLSSNFPNGYKVAVFYKEKDNLCIWHFQRGDSIDRYIAGHELPWTLRSGCGSALHDDVLDKFYDPVDTTLVLPFDIPIVKQLKMNAADGDICFMDVNFDGHEEFIIAHSGYNLTHYACFDLVNGEDIGHNVCPGFLESLRGVFGQLVGGYYGETEFDHEKKIIHIKERLGCCKTVETWAKPIYDTYNSGKVKVFKEIRKEFWGNGEEHVRTYQLVNDTLKLVSHEINRY